MKKGLVVTGSIWITVAALIVLNYLAAGGYEFSGIIKPWLFWTIFLGSPGIVMLLIGLRKNKILDNNPAQLKEPSNSSSSSIWGVVYFGVPFLFYFWAYITFSIPTLFWVGPLALVLGLIALVCFAPGRKLTGFNFAIYLLGSFVAVVLGFIATLQKLF